MFYDVIFEDIILSYKKVTAPWKKADAKVYKILLKLFDFSPYAKAQE